MANLRVIAVVIAVVGSLWYTTTFAGTRDQQHARLPKCSKKPPLTVSPLAIDGFTHILPLGNLNPPDHTIPTDHIYFMLKSNYPDPPSVANVYAPGNIRITSISQSSAYQGKNLMNQDYAIEFAVCDGVTGKFGHVSTLVPALKKKAGQWDSCQTYQAGTQGNSYKNCSKQLDLPIHTSTKIGTAGGKQSAALDLWILDSRKPKLKFANPSRYFDTILTTRCPVDYFVPSVKRELTERLGDLDKRRIARPVCGSIMQDKAGTLQGNWFTQNAKDDSQGWSKSLALVHDNRDGVAGAISWGGVIGSPGVWYFSPQHNSTINREFSEVKPSRTVYCYDNPSLVYKTGSSGRILIQLVNAKTLKIERQSGPCSDTVDLSNPTTYRR